MAYSELVKSFERIRNYMREFYVYGFKSRDEYGMKSARSYDNERRRIESWLGDYMSFHQESSGKKVFLSMPLTSMRSSPTTAATASSICVPGSPSCWWRRLHGSAWRAMPAGIPISSDA